LRNFFLNRSVQIFLLVCYLFLLIYLLFFAYFRIGTTTAINLIPFKTIVNLTLYTMQTGQDIWHWFVNVPGNIVAFIPLPFILNIVVRIRPKVWLIILISAFIPIVAESLQYLFKRGAFDIDDLILNFLGMLIGYFFLVKKQRQPVN